MMALTFPPTFSNPASSATTSLGQAQEQVYEYFPQSPPLQHAAICAAIDKQKSQVSEIIKSLLFIIWSSKKKELYYVQYRV